MPANRFWQRCLAAFLGLTLLLPGAGCGPTLPSPALHQQLLHERLALRPDPGEVPIALSLFARGKGKGMVRGMGEGIAGTLGGWNGGGCEGAFCGIALLAVLSFAVVVGGSVGAVHGYRAATTKKRAEAIEAFTAARLGGIEFNRQLAVRVQEESRREVNLELKLAPPPASAPLDPDVGELHDLERRGFQKLVVLHLKRLEFSGDKGNDPRLKLWLEVQAAIVDTASGKDLYQRQFNYQGTARKYSDWMALEPGSLLGEWELALDRMARDIVLTLFCTES